MPDDQSSTPKHYLFDWLAHLALATGRNLVSGKQASIAIFVALNSKGTSGEQATIDVKRLELELQLQERQIWRHFKVLCDRGWFEQTANPTRGYKGEAGRRARYRLTTPTLSVSLDSKPNHVTQPLAEESSEAPTAQDSSDASSSNRVTVRPESSDIVTVTGGTDSTSDGFTSGGSTPPTHPAASTTDRARETLVAKIRDDIYVAQVGNTAEPRRVANG